MSVIEYYFNYSLTCSVTGKMAEVEIIPSTNSDRNDQPSFILRIFTEQKHASDIVQMLTGQTDSTLGPVCPTDQGVSTVNIEDADAPQDQPRTFTSPQLQTSNLETGNVVHNEGSDASENEPQQYYPALS